MSVEEHARQSIRLAGAPNFRDLGGVRTRDGRFLPPGRLYRSQALLKLDEPQWEIVEKLGIRLACDLRSPAEQAKHVVPWPDSVRALSMPVLPDERASSAEVLRRIASDPTGRAASRQLEDNYAAMPSAFAESLPGLLDGILDRDDVPVLLYCMEGKDRTGFVSALLLTALGVEWDAVVADYLRSAPFYDPVLVRRVLEGAGTAPTTQVVDALRVRPRYLEAAFAAMTKSYGGVEGYLAKAGGLTPRRLDALRSRLLSPQRNEE